MNGASNILVVKGPISFHRLLKRAPHLGQASALLLTSCPQSLHGLSRANNLLPMSVIAITTALGCDFNRSTQHLN